MAPGLGARVALAEDSGSVPSITVGKCLEPQFQGSGALFWFPLHPHGSHPQMQVKTNTHNFKKGVIFPLKRGDDSPEVFGNF